MKEIDELKQEIEYLSPRFNDDDHMKLQSILRKILEILNILDKRHQQKMF